MAPQPLSTTEERVLEVLIAASAENGHEYGVFADIEYPVGESRRQSERQLTGRQFAAYVQVLQRKGYIKTHGPSGTSRSAVRTFALTPVCKRIYRIHTPHNHRKGTR
jgi:hypothetical protein